MAKTKTIAAQTHIDGAFLSVLQQHRKGEVLSDLAEAMREVAGAVTLTGKAGTVMLKIKIRPASKGGALVVEDEVKTALPKTETQGSIFFADDKGNLLREDPNQTTLPLRTIEGGAEEKTVPLKKVAEQYA